jgi:predicted porin
MLWFPTYVQILRSAGGAIPANASVLIDYALAPQNKSTVDTSVLNAGTRYDFTQGPLKGFGAYVQYLMQNQSVDSEDSAYQADQIRDLTLGADYRAGNWFVNAEYERHDSTISPFESWRTGVQYSRRLGYDTVLAANANYVEFDYADSGDRLNILTTAVSVEHEFSTHLFGRASLGWFRQDDRLMGTTTGTEGALGLQWRYGRTQLYTNVRAVHLDADSRSSDFQLLEIGLSRSF